MTRMTKTVARAELVKLNAKMASLGSAYQFEMEGRNGYQGLDLYRDGKCVHTVMTGTPAKCLNAAKDFLIATIPA